MLYKIKIENVDNLFFDSKDSWIYFLNEVYFTFGFNVFNPFKFNSDDYNNFNYYIIEKLKLYDEVKRELFEGYIEKCINNKNYTSCLYNSVPFTIEKTNLNLHDYDIIF